MDVVGSCSKSDERSFKVAFCVERHPPPCGAEKRKKGRGCLCCPCSLALNVEVTGFKMPFQRGLNIFEKLMASFLLLEPILRMFPL